MIRARLVRNWSSFAQATAIAVALCFGAVDIPVFGVFVAPAAATSERDFTEDDVKSATKKVDTAIPDKHYASEMALAPREEALFRSL